MAKNESDREEGSVAVLERDDGDAGGERETVIAERPVEDGGETRKREKKGKKQKDEEELEYEVEFATPFGKLEFEFEPKSSKERKEREKREKAAREQAKASAKAEKKAQTRGNRPEPEAPARGGGSLLPILLIAGLVIGAIALAYWLFARPEEDEMVPEQYRNDDLPVTEPQGFAGRARRRIREAVRAGRRASREAQDEELRKYEEMTEGRA